MNNKYTYGRLFEFCVDDDYKKPGRGVIRRKGRIPTGVFSYCLLIVMLLFFILEISKTRWIGIIGVIAAFGFIYETKTGIFSWINVLAIAKLRKKTDQNILEKFYIYHNRDGNYIKIQEKDMYKIKYHPFCWSIVKIYFKDEYDNKYIYRINLKVVSLIINLSNAYKETYLRNNKVNMKLSYQYSNKDLNEINDVKELLMFIRGKYRNIKSEIKTVE